MGECRGFSCQDDKHRLRDFLGQVPVSNLSQARGIDHVHVLANDLRKGPLVVSQSILLKQLPLPLGFAHAPNYVRDPPNSNKNNFAGSACLATLWCKLMAVWGGMGNCTQLPVSFGSIRNTGKRIRLPMPPHFPID